MSTKLLQFFQLFSDVLVRVVFLEDQVEPFTGLDFVLLRRIGGPDDLHGAGTISPGVKKMIKERTYLAERTGSAR